MSPETKKKRKMYNNKAKEDLVFFRVGFEFHEFILFAE